MRNFVQEGDALSLLAPYALAAGDGALVGSLFVVAKTAAANGAAFEGVPEGVFTLTKETHASTQAWTPGLKLYWDNTNKRVTITATSNTLIGCAIAAVASTVATGNVYLDGVIR